VSLIQAVRRTMRRRHLLDRLVDGDEAVDLDRGVGLEAGPDDLDAINR